MFIGALSKQTGASRKAIYLYERMGLLPKPRRQGSYRLYAPEMVELIQTIKCAQALGFTLKELAGVMHNPAAPWPNLTGIQELLQAKQLALKAQIATATDQLQQLQQLKQQLEQPAAFWGCEKTP